MTVSLHSNAAPPKKPPSIGFARALKLFHKAAHRVPAYKDFLRKHKINPDRIETLDDFSHVPLTDKPNYISKYPLEALSWDGALKKASYISSSSGSTGTPFFWPRGNDQNTIAGTLFGRVFEDIFHTKRGSTLFVDLFALGTWIAGLEFYNAAKFTADQGSSLAIVTPGIEKLNALDSLKRLSGSFDRIILAGYPPFVKDILESGTEAGLRWDSMDVRLFMGGESVSELWRDFVLERMGKKGSLEHIINLYGMAETGVVGHETPFSVALRRTYRTMPALTNLLQYEGTDAALYQYDPLVRFFEVGPDKNLILTAPAGLPLIRYNTRDQGGILSHHELVRHTKEQPSLLKLAQAWERPVVYLYGRRDLSLSFFALNVYVENIKLCMETYRHHHRFSGLFSMRVTHTKKLDQQFEIVIELARNMTAPNIKELTEHVVRTLKSVNSEYAKTHDSIGKRALPRITCVTYGTLETMPGRKHRWVKRV